MWSRQRPHLASQYWQIAYSFLIVCIQTSSLQGETLEIDKRWVRLMTQQIQIAEVEIVADIGTTKVTLGDILNMKEGDIIPLSIPDIISAKVDGTPVMECKYGVFNGQYALRVEKLISSSVNEIVQESGKGDSRG